jgi:hypothetical protein
MNLTPLGLLELIHGHTEDSRINFCAKGQERFERLASIKTSDLKELLPTIEPHLSQDAYFSINGFSQASNRTNRATGLPKPAGRKRNLQRLNGLMVDVDSGRHGTDRSDPKNEPTQEAMWRALENCDQRGFPLPTLWAESGRGFYVFWAFIEPLRAWHENIERVEQAQRALGWIHPAADTAATDAGRIYRIAGTRHGTTGKVTEWRTGANNGTKYEEQELCGLLGIESRKRTFRITQQPGSAPERANGPRVLSANRASDIRALHRARGGFSEGMRRQALTTYAVARLLEGASPFDIAAELERMAGECQPAFPSHANDPKPHKILQDAMKLKGHKQRWTDDTISKRLEVTAEEADKLKLKQLRPQDSNTKAERRATRSLNEGMPKRATRQEFVKSYLKAHPQASVRELLEAAKAQGIKASIGTIHSDMKA